MHNFYGDAETILNKMDAIPVDLGERRVYFLLVESADAADVRFFERVDEDNWAVSSWSGESLDGLVASIHETILKNRGIHCIGEQLKALITESLEMKLEGMVPGPASPRAAFGHTVRALGTEDYVRTTTAILC